MHSLPLTDATRRMAPPANWNHATQGICHTLEIADVDGWMISAWHASENERAAIAEGKPIFLHIQGTLHPVVGLSVESPDNKPVAAITEREAVFAALRKAVDHITHMAEWIGKQNAGYSFEGLGEDLPGIRDALAKGLAK